MSINTHPTLPEFEYIKPNTLAEASKFLKEHAGEARPILGGTDSFVRMRDGIWKDKYLVDLKGLPGMYELAFDPSKGLTIGAAVPINQVSAFPEVKKYYPLLAEAADSVASYQLRNRATVVGNICNASPAGDTIGACLVLGAVLNVRVQQEPLHSFFKGPGETILSPGDIVLSVGLPIPPQGAQGVYKKHGRNKISDLAMVGVTVYGYPDKSAASGYRFKLALASVAPTPIVVDEVEKILADNPITDDQIFKAAEAAQKASKPIDDVRASGEYRKAMVKNLSLTALNSVWDKLNLN
jgi:carbon-monoxide dehydrogenase medium subunit